MGSKAQLVDQIKSLQRSDPAAKQAWWDYCDIELQGVKDPNRHEPNVLRTWLDDYTSGAGPPPQTRAARTGGFERAAPARARPAVSAPTARVIRTSASPQSPWQESREAFHHAPAASTASGSSLSDFVKIGQRHSLNWKTAWQTYCAVYGTGFNDPTKYEESFIKNFIEYVGELASDGLNAIAEQQRAENPPANKRTRGALDAHQPPAKRQAAAVDADPTKQALVDKIKALQRSDPEAKQAWWAFCDTECNGVKDPMRQEVDVLELFLSSFE